MNSGVASALGTAAAAPQGKERAGHPGAQQPPRLMMPWNRPRTDASGDSEALPEWKLHCLCAEQTQLSPTMRGGLHIGGGWF